ncbi:glycopeptide [Panaeolus papilionaceus]|nr:glycopeptide [Panaeolus papilionaceus]
MFSFKSFAAALAIAVVAVKAETHTVHFANNCGQGTPMLVQNGNVLSSGADLTTNGPLFNALAFLQTGSCGANGEGCTLVEFTLANPESDSGSGSVVDLSLIPPRAFSVPTGFGFLNGCDGRGANCTTPECTSAFHDAGDSQASLIACQLDDVSLAISFC